MDSAEGEKIFETVGKGNRASWLAAFGLPQSQGIGRRRGRGKKKRMTVKSHHPAQGSATSSRTPLPWVGEGRRNRKGCVPTLTRGSRSSTCLRRPGRSHPRGEADFGVDWRNWRRPRCHSLRRGSPGFPYSRRIPVQGRRVRRRAGLLAGRIPIATVDMSSAAARGVPRRDTAHLGYGDCTVSRYAEGTPRRPRDEILGEQYLPASPISARSYCRDLACHSAHASTRACSSCGSSRSRAPCFRTPFFSCVSSCWTAAAPALPPAPGSSSPSAGARTASSCTASS
ncbi:hypothetical protein VTK73DRAFT_720 [Phialemonium thermophilum]|uniref:Uncharacterized protein n=1 Tax=Phialemonium thermophilum TaxID=223376 RepID=A0ABR3VUK1_9PEZI